MRDKLHMRFEAACRRPMVADRQNSNNDVMERFRKDVIESLKIRFSSEELQLYKLINHYGTQGRLNASNGNVGGSIQWFLKAEKVCSSKILGRDARAMAESDLRAAEAYVSMYCKDFEEAESKLLQAATLNASLANWSGESFYLLRLHHILANLIRVRSLSGSVSAAVSLAADLLRCLEGHTVDLPHASNSFLPNTLSDEMLDWQRGQLLTEIAFLAVVARPDSTADVSCLFGDRDLHASTFAWSAELRSWFCLKRQLFFSSSFSFLEGVCTSLEADPGSWPVFRYLIAYDGARVLAEQTSHRRSFDEMKKAIADSSYIPRAHKKIIASRMPIVHATSLFPESSEAWASRAPDRSEHP
jgi:hypothetical protein